MKNAFNILECTAFFSFIRIVIAPADADDGIISIKILRSGIQIDNTLVESQKFHIDSNRHGVIEALIDRAAFPDSYVLEILSRHGIIKLACRELVEAERAEHSYSTLGDFMVAVESWRAQRPGVTPKVLDIGGRARSGFLLSDDLRGCAITVLDILDGRGVDVVADIHEMGSVLDDKFDFIFCVSVFEHLVMPWKAAIEMNRVLADGGIAFVLTHQTVGMHDLPWDYYRFSDQSWKGLFNAASGFEIVKTMMTDFARITPMHYFKVEPDGENAGGFIGSAVIARKIGPTSLEWPVGLTSIVDTAYPA